MPPRTLLLFFWALVASLVASTSLSSSVLSAQVTPESDTAFVPIYAGLGSHSHAVIASAHAQAYFDQGLRLTYAFDRAGAARSFRQATRFDPRCAMCWWGIGLALGPYINGTDVDSAHAMEAFVAVQRAESLSATVSEQERAYIAAMARRYGAPGSTLRRGQLDSAYANAMRDVAHRYPSDADALVNFAEALMVLHAWDWYPPNGKAHPEIYEAVSVLERALVLDSNHPGACHYYIHAVEASKAAQRAASCAGRLGSLMPGASHLVHMPAHIYLRLGRWDDAVRISQLAHHVDHLADVDGPLKRAPGVYTNHNLDFLRAAAMMNGESRVAIEAARQMTAKDTSANAAVLLQVALARFGRWPDLLAINIPPSKDTVVVGIRIFATGLAHLRNGSLIMARAALDSVQAMKAAVGDTGGIGSSPRVILGVAAGLLAGEIAAADHRTDEAIRLLSLAARVEDSLRYNEPPDWPLPVRQYLGSVLLESKRPKDAERIYRADLERNPNNGWSLFGLAASLRAQGKATEARRVQRQFAKAWARSDVTLNASRF